ncbi:MAG TPA: polysaccharide biosynthesis/export family protein [Blastocatellia bacterium]|nr:polysaccharide biosynthesis/export family protein [Blastocatellia bacterium]
MITRKITGLSFLLLFCCAMAAQAQTPTDGQPAEKRAMGRDYRIGPGDVLLVEVAGEPDLKRRARVSEQGTISLLYVGDLKVEGLTVAEAGALLRRSYLSILKQPEVTVYIEEYGAHIASVIGAVNKPRRVPLTRELRVFDLLSEGGGLTEKAGNIVQLIHVNRNAGGEQGSAEGRIETSEGAIIAESVEYIDLRDLVRRPELNRVIRDGDVIVVPEASVFFVTGSVRKPGQFVLKEAVRVSQAIAMAGGLELDSKKKEIQLIRSTEPGKQATVARVINLAEIEKDPSKDIYLQPYDVVMVPESTRAKNTRTLVQTFAGGLASALGWGIIR